MLARLMTFVAFLILTTPALAQTAAEEGNAAYSRGDFAAARTAWAKASYKDPQAAYNLAILFETGRGGPVDHKKAFEWYERALRNGLEDGRMQMARVFVQTRDLSLFAKASMYTGRAVKTKDPNAIYMAGRVYEVQGTESKAQGIARWFNPLRFAWGYFNYAAQLGHPQANDAKQRVISELGRKHSKNISSVMKTIRFNIEGRKKKT